MKIVNDQGCKYLELTKSSFITFYNDWEQLFGGCNWYTFTGINIEIENDKMMGGYEFTFIILGLGFRWRWNHTETEATKSCKDAIKDIENGTAKFEEYTGLVNDIKSDEE
jgi:hypothetical protein